ncbi:MAG: hypothetical protein WBG01_07790, partial [Bacteroidota bacterium]
MKTGRLRQGRTGMVYLLGLMFLMLHLQAHAAGSAARRHTNQDPWVSLANSGRLKPLYSPASGLLASGGGAFGLHTNSPLSSMM